MIKSDLADIKNIGGREAGAITAGKFLEKFTKYPLIHLGEIFTFADNTKQRRSVICFSNAWICQKRCLKGP